jgi:hypothetical protein
LLRIATYPIEVPQTSYERVDVYSLSSSSYNLWGKEHSGLANCTSGGASWMPEDSSVFVQRLNVIQGLGAHHIALVVEGVPGRTAFASDHGWGWFRAASYKPEPIKLRHTPSYAGATIRYAAYHK